MQARETLQMLHLPRNNYAALVDNRPAFLGMLRTAKDYVTYGEPARETVDLLIKSKGRLMGNKELTDDCAQKLGFKSLDDLVDAVYTGRTEYWKLKGVQPLFRLHPPSKGFKGKIKRHYGAGGELGNRGAEINELLKRML
jgi:large subunit ribosomal protein L30